MGPRHFSHGTIWASLMFLVALSLQWGRGISATELTSHWISRPSRWCFNGAAAFQPRNLACEPPSARPPRSFNGAAAFQPRNYLHAYGPGTRERPSMGPRHFSRGTLESVKDANKLQTASMGPRHFSRGTRRRRLHLIFQLDCFNGAAAFQPRNCRGLLSVCHHSISSMGPRHFSRGTRLVSPRMTWWNGSSMRPRHFSRGTPVRVFDHTNRYLHPFNYGRRALVPFAVQFAVLQ